MHHGHESATRLEDDEPADARYQPDPPATLANWQDPPYNKWSFCHMREVIPTQLIAGDPATTRPLHEARRPVGEVQLTRLDGSVGTLDDVLADTHTDAFLMLQDGKVVDERYVGQMTPASKHLVMSVSKSIVGCVAACLVDRGLLDPRDDVTKHVPEVADSGYGGATVRNLLDMRTGVAFRETYKDIDAEVRVMERSMGWRPRRPGDPVGAYAFLTTLGRSSDHGGRFTYRSADTDLLGWVCERAAGTRIADLISELVWQPMGAEFDAEITCDAVGSAISDGGVSCALRDLGRFGTMLLDDGAVDGHQVVPAWWLEQSYRPDPDVRQAFAVTPDEQVLPGGWYRNQFWFIPGLDAVNLVCLGIHGQMVHVNPVTRTVSVKLSSWPDPQNAPYLVDTLRAFGNAGTYLSAVPSTASPTGPTAAEGPMEVRDSRGPRLS